MTSPDAKGQIRQTNEALILAAAERVFAKTGFSGATMAQIAQAAGLPKANLHYYFGSKEALYRVVLARILQDWLEPAHGITPEADPREAIASYVRSKMALSTTRADASKIWANELLHGAPHVKSLLETELRALVRSKAAVIDQWVADGKMAPVDSTHLFFTIWATTQTYADFDVQIQAILGRGSSKTAQRTRAIEHVLTMILRGCGLSPPEVP